MFPVGTKSGAVGETGHEKWKDGVEWRGNGEVRSHQMFPLRHEERIPTRHDNPRQKKHSEGEGIAHGVRKRKEREKGFPCPVKGEGNMGQTM